MSTLITGSNGFVGSNLTKYLSSKDLKIITSSRKKYDSNGFKHFQITELNQFTNWRQILKGVKNIIHTAACVHQMSKSSSNDEKKFREVNTLGTINLFKQATKSKVERFIFLSTIGVCGSETIKQFNEKSPTNPKTLYAKSKLEAEKYLISLAKESKTKLIIIRPPMIIGPGAPGNFDKLVNAINRNLPLPLKSVEFNKKSFLSITNLNDFIYRFLSTEYFKNDLFVLADSQYYSTSYFVELLCHSLKKKNILVPFPPSLLKKLLQIIGKEELSIKLLSNMQIDSSYARKSLEWNPPISTETELENCFREI